LIQVPGTRNLYACHTSKVSGTISLSVSDAENLGRVPWALGRLHGSIVAAIRRSDRRSAGCGDDRPVQVAY